MRKKLKKNKRGREKWSYWKSKRESKRKRD